MSGLAMRNDGEWNFGSALSSELLSVSCQFRSSSKVESALRKHLQHELKSISFRHKCISNTLIDH